MVDPKRVDHSTHPAFSETKLQQFVGLPRWLCRNLSRSCRRTAASTGASNGQNLCITADRVRRNGQGRLSHIITLGYEKTPSHQSRQRQNHNQQHLRLPRQSPAHRPARDSRGMDRWRMFLARNERTPRTKCSGRFVFVKLSVQAMKPPPVPEDRPTS